MNDLITVLKDAMSDEAVFEFAGFFQRVIDGDVGRALLLASHFIINRALQISPSEETVIGQCVNRLLLQLFTHQILSHVRLLLLLFVV